jgi:DNA polymerase-3 subunit gamma/tau
MISQAAFNALLKVVEEPPPHVKFIFATTEPEKVLPTIKSRTFHYRFRLIPPAVLREFLAGLCAREGIEVDPLVLPVVVRAGAGSARDALSVLDQLAAGAGGEGVTYQRALSILGYTDGALLDETVEAFGADDGAAVFQAVDRVIEAGIDPRRFAQDLLERFRDLLVLDAVADAGDSGLLDLPADTLERMRAQAARFGRASLSRAGDVMAQALVDMRGTTSPRLVLELACARVLLPGAESDTSALLARLDRLERRLSVSAPVSPPAPAPVAAANLAPDSGRVAPDVPEPARQAPAEDTPTPAELAAPTPSAAPEPAVERPAASSQVGAVDIVAMRSLWPDLLDAVKERSKTANALLRNASPEAIDTKAVTIAFESPQLEKMFKNSKEFFREALREILGLDLDVRTTTSEAPTAASNGGSSADSSAEQDVVELTVSSDDEDAEPPAPAEDPVALLQQNLGAQVIGEIDSA